MRSHRELLDDQGTRDAQSEQKMEPGEARGVLPQWGKNAPWWAISATLHLAVLLLIGGLVLAEAREEKKVRGMIAAIRRPPQKMPDDRTTPPGETVTPRIPGRKSKVPPVTRLRPEPLTPDIPKGTSEKNLSDTELAGRFAVDTIGLSGGRAGRFGDLYGHGAPAPGDGSQGTGDALYRALDWLRRHQGPDGSWSCHDFLKQCDSRHGPCRIHPANRVPWGDEGRGWKEHDIGVTALAVLAFTGSGHTHFLSAHPPFRETLRRAASFLESVQIRGTGDPRYDGCFRLRETIPSDSSKETQVDEELEWMYDHSIATMAAAELLALTGDFQLGRCVEDATRFCLRAQTPGSGWRYSVRSTVPDTSVTGWMVLALKTVKTCLHLGFVNDVKEEELEQAFRGALAWLDAVTSEATGITGYQAPGDQGSVLRELASIADGYPFSKEPSCMTAVGVLCRLFAGERRSSPAVKRGVEVLMAQLPLWRPRRGKALSTINFYYWYYGTLALFQHGSSKWEQWNESMKRALIDSQRWSKASPEACETGSWDPICEWGPAGGRVYATAMGALTLEVYWRYKRAREGAGFEATAW